MPVFTLGVGCSVAAILVNSGFMLLTVDAAARPAVQTVSKELAIVEPVSRARKNVLLPGATIFGFRACRSLYEFAIHALSLCFQSERCIDGSRDILAAPC